MKRLTAREVNQLLEKRAIDQERAPIPYPGRNSPTRVAWVISYGTGLRPYMRLNPTYTPDGEHGPQFMKAYKFAKTHKFQYFGKPNRFRALQALKLLNTGRIIEASQIEFDKGGPLAWVRFKDGARKVLASSAYTAYHPHSAGVDIIQSFSKPVYVKRIGRMSVYSHARKLSVEKLDAFYAWYEKTFGKKLRRPKQAPMEIESGPSAEF